ncbi:hypothetical protein ABH931_003989 [Streptacidiphilus sp. MAP12-33]|uniref:hypothetical protein n=1 Tax=Streptacidiphilus sp. MAP12-33 TaxID=3156266 RepID=UPI0035187518
MRLRPIIVGVAAAAAVATAGGVAAASTGTSQPAATPSAGSAAVTATPSAGTSQPVATPSAGASSTPAGGASSTPGSGGGVPSSGPVTLTPVAFTVVGAQGTPISAGAVAEILASCLGPDASRYHAVLALRAPIASADQDGVVVAVNSAKQYVQCETKGRKGTSQSVPPTFINDRLWGSGHLIEYFDSTGEPAGGGRYLLLGAGHYAANVARITISYGSDPKQYPAQMAGGAFAYTTALSTNADQLGPNIELPTPYVHAYDASGHEIYNQKNDPTL